MTAAAWIYDEPWRELNPPAEVMAISETRTPEALSRVPLLLCLEHAKRYQPIPRGPTWCNVFVSDALKILRAPIPHVFDLSDGRGPREMQANDMVDGLRAVRFPGWYMVGTMASAQAVTELASRGIPQVAVWKNPMPRKDSEGRILTLKGRTVFQSGHVVLVVPTPAGKSGVYVSGAGRQCVHQCPISWAFGSQTQNVEFYRFEK